MTKEDKELLLKDLCARLPYKPNIRFSIIGVEWYEVCKLLPEHITLLFLNEDADFKPYLRPMSSMTEEEKNEHFGRTMTIDIVQTSKEVIDWLNAHHFDYNGLIDKGLAIEVTEENNPYKE